MRNICVVGIGNMGKAILTTLKSAPFCNVFACGRGEDINEKLEEADCFILAVKPQDFEDLAQSINIDLSGKLVISIMAGVSIARMQELLKMKKVVRTLPNLPLKIRKAVTVWKASEDLSGIDRELVEEMIETFGVSIEVQDEDEIGNIGALSGCGPGYFAYFTEIMKEMAMEMGLDEKTAEEMASMTFVGSGELLEVDGMSSTELRERICSKGGITIAAIEKMKEEGFDKAFKSGIDAAIKRTEELNS